MQLEKTKFKANNGIKPAVEIISRSTTATLPPSLTPPPNLNKDLAGKGLGVNIFQCSSCKQEFENKYALIYHITAPKSRCSISHNLDPTLASHHNVSQDQETRPSESKHQAPVQSALNLFPKFKPMGDDTNAQAARVVEDQSITSMPNDSTKRTTRKPKPDDGISESTRKRRIAKEKKEDQRKRTVEARKSRIEYLEKNGVERPEGPCRPCKNRGTVCKISIGPPSRSSSCLRCLRYPHVKCVFPGLGYVVPETEVTSTRRFPHRVPLQLYSPSWFRGLSKNEKNRALAELITSNIQDLKSGTPRHPGPCQPCFEFGLECRVIKEGSVARKLSGSKRCSNCLDDSTRSRMRYHSKHPLGCCNIPEGCLPQRLSPSDPKAIAPTTKANPITLESGDLVQENNLKRCSRRLERELFPDIFPDDDPVRLMPPSLSEVTDLAGDLYQWIEDLSLAVDALHKARSSSPLPFSPTGLLELESLSVPSEEPSLPTIAEATQRGLGIQGNLATTEVSDQIRQFGLDGCSLFTIIPLITSVLIYRLVMGDHGINPFSRGGIATRTEEVVSSIRKIFPSQSLGQHWIANVIDNFHLVSLSAVSLGRDPELLNQLDNIAMSAAKKLFRVLKPLLTMGLTHVSEPELDVLQDKCSGIARVATRLNAQLIARSESNQISYFWPCPGRKFNDRLYRPFAGSGFTIGDIRRVKIARLWGIKMRDRESGQCRTLAKSECELVLL